MSGDAVVDRISVGIKGVLLGSKLGSVCFCPLARTEHAVSARHIAGLRCEEPLSATDLAKHLLDLCEGKNTAVPKYADRVVAVVSATVAEAMLGSNVGGKPDAAIAFCVKALSLDPRCAEAYGTLAALLDISGGTAVVNGQRLGSVALRDKSTRLCIEDMAGKPFVAPLSSGSSAASVPTAVAVPAACPEVADYVKSVGPYRLDKLPQPHAMLAAVVRRDATLGWLEATRRGVAAPDSTGLPPSAALQQAADALLLPGGDGDGVAAAPARADALVSARCKAFETLLAMADEQGGGGSAGSSSGSGVAGRCQASLQLYLALAFLSVDAPASIERQLASARARAKGATAGAGLPEPRYSDDARRALQAYRDAAVAGVAYWDHSYLLIALVHEVRRLPGVGSGVA